MDVFLLLLVLSSTSNSNGPGVPLLARERAFPRKLPADLGDVQPSCDFVGLFFLFVIVYIPHVLLFFPFAFSRIF